jgi:hypothetical protein
METATVMPPIQTTTTADPEHRTQVVVGVVERLVGMAELTKVVMGEQGAVV